MRRVSLAFLCMASTGHGQQLPDFIDRLQSALPENEIADAATRLYPCVKARGLHGAANAVSVANPSKVLALCLIALNPAVMFKPACTERFLGSNLKMVSSRLTKADRNRIACCVPEHCARCSDLVVSMSATGSSAKPEHLVSSAQDDGFKEDNDKEFTRADQFRYAHHIIVKKRGDHIGGSPDPFYSFDETPFASEIQDVLREQGYEEPTPIQAQSWPIALEGRDLIAIGKSGSGKTLSFLLPAFHKLMQDATKVEAPAPLPPAAAEGGREFIDFLKIPKRLVGPFVGPGGENFKKLRKKTGCSSIKIESQDLPDDAPRTIVVKGPIANVQAAVERLHSAIHYKAAPRILVLGPTRELVTQIAAEGDKYTRAAGVKALRLSGGHKGSSKTSQIFLLRTIRPELITGTPGCVLAHLRLRELDLSSVEYVVLDEADRMLDMGLGPQIRDVFSHLPNQRQTLMFSATWPQKIRSLSNQLLHNPVILNIGGDRNTFNANDAIKQHVKILSQAEKEPELLSLMHDIRGNEENSLDLMPRTLIFVSHKADCDHLADMLLKNGYGAEAFHGGIQQFERTKIMGRFRRGESRILVATDVAARGLDVDDIKAVVNYDMPPGKDAGKVYVHRIGRTARGNKDGLSYTFFTHEDRKNAKSLVGILERAGQEVPDDLRAMTVRHEIRVKKLGRTATSPPATSASASHPENVGLQEHGSAEAQKHHAGDTWIL